MDDRTKAHFDVLFGSLKDYQSGLLQGAFTASGFLILVIGWLLTSTEARTYLGSNARARRFGVMVLAVGAILFTAVSWRVFVLSQSAYSALVELDYLPTSAYAAHRIQGSTLFLFLAQNALLALLACYFMLGTAPRRRTTP